MAGVVLRIDRDPWLGTVEKPQICPSRPSSEEPNELQLYGQAAENPPAKISATLTDQSHWDAKARGKRLPKTRILTWGKDRENGDRRSRTVPRGPDWGR